MLIEQVQAWKVRQLELTVYRHGEPARQHQWTAPSSGRSECSWSVGVSFLRPGGQSCKLRAAIGDPGVQEELLRLSDTGGAPPPASAAAPGPLQIAAPMETVAQSSNGVELLPSMVRLNKSLEKEIKE